MANRSDVSYGQWVSAPNAGGPASWSTGHMGKSLANQGLPAVLGAGALILMGSAVGGPRTMSQIQPLSPKGKPGLWLVQKTH